MAGSPPLIPPPGGKKAKDLVDAYLKCVDEDIYEGKSANEEENRRKWTTSQEKRRDYFKAIPKQDLVIVAEDEARHTAWKELNIKHERAQLHSIIHDIALADKTLETIRLAEHKVSTELAELDPRVAPAPDVEKNVQLIKRMMNAAPRIAYEVLDDAQPALERSFYLACDQLRDQIVRIEKQITKEAIEECLARALKPESWEKMVEHFRMTDAPRAALEESIELAETRAELQAVKQDLQREKDRADDNAELYATAEEGKREEKVQREEAERKLAHEEYARQRTESNLRNAEALIQEQKSKLRGKENVEAELAQLRPLLDSVSEEKRELERKLAAADSDKQSAQESAEAKLVAVEKALREEYEGKLEAAKQEAALGLTNAGLQA